MIYVDDRVGSKEIIPYFKPWGVDVESTQLNSADFCFVGYGEDGDSMVGIERKRVSDLIQSMREGRLSGHQLPKLLDDYQYVYLLVEGVYRPGPTGALEVLKGRDWRAYGSGQGRKPIMYAEVDNYLNSLSLRTPVMVKRSNDERETAAIVVNLWKHFQKEWDKHHSHQGVYAPVPEPKKVGWKRESWSLKQEEVRAVASQIPGIDRKCDAVARKFHTVGEMVSAREGKWLEIPGIGKELAVRAREFFSL